MKIMDQTMKQIPILLIVLIIAGMPANCFAGCDCDEWVNKGGYCVDYVKEKIPSFPLPKTHAEAATLVNKETADITVGDVAVFHYRNYWHFAYVEKVHRTKTGDAAAIDVSEMNFGGHLSFDEYKTYWNSSSEDEWKNALCCGVTDRYDRTSLRKNITLNTVRQIWSPDSAVMSEDKGRVVSAVDKVREVLSRIMEYAERVL